MTFLIVGLLIIVLIAFALSTTMSDEDKIRAFIEEQGGEFISSSRNWKAGRFEERGFRFYDCNYRDAAGDLQDQLLRVGWGEVKVIQ